MHSCPLIPNIKELVEFLPVVHQQLESIHASTELSKNYLINRALMHDFGIPDVPLNDETAWGVTRPPIKNESWQ